MTSMCAKSSSPFGSLPSAATASLVNDVFSTHRIFFVAALVVTVCTHGSGTKKPFSGKRERTARRPSTHICSNHTTPPWPLSGAGASHTPPPTSRQPVTSAPPDITAPSPVPTHSTGEPGSPESAGPNSSGRPSV